MLHSPNANIPLNSEQTQQIEEAKKRLSNLENEISIATKNLSAASKNVFKTIKDKEYQQELIEKFTKEAITKSRELESLKNSVDEMQKTLTKLRIDADDTKNIHLKKDIELREKESSILFSERELAKKLNELESDIKKVQEDKKVIEDVKKAFSIASKSIVWK